MFFALTSPILAFISPSIMTGLLGLQSSSPCHKRFIGSVCFTLFGATYAKHMLVFLSRLKYSACNSSHMHSYSRGFFCLTMSVMSLWTRTTTPPYILFLCSVLGLGLWWVVKPSTSRTALSSICDSINPIISCLSRSS